MKWIMGLMMLLAITLGGPASAFEFTKGKTVHLKIVGCDTLEQTQTLMDTWTEAGWDAYISAKSRLNRVINEYGQPSCGVMSGPMIPLDVLGVYEVLDQTGEPMTVYLILFELGGGQVLYTISPYSMEIEDSIMYKEV